MLIVIEGLDGSGKSTQVGKVREYLEGKNPGKLKYIHFPRYEEPVFGDLISRFLRGDFGGNGQVHPMLVALLFAQDRREAAPKIRQWLESGDIVLFDRYVYSNIAYQCAKTKSESESDELREWILNTEYGQFDIPEPDLNIFLDVPISFVNRNLSDAREGDDREYLNGGNDIHEADIEFQKKVRALYLEQCEADRSFIRVDCSGTDGSMLSPDVIFSKLKQVIG